MKALYSNTLQPHTTTDLPLYNDRFTLYTTTDLPLYNDRFTLYNDNKNNVVVLINAFII